MFGYIKDKWQWIDWVLYIATVTLIAVKVFGIFDLSWFIVLAPICTISFFFILLHIYMMLNYYKKKKEESERMEKEEINKKAREKKEIINIWEEE